MLNRLLIRFFERKDTKGNIINKIMYRLFWNRYKNLFVNSCERKELSFNYWGRDGGFLHAIKQFKRDKSDWSGLYGSFYNIVLQYLKDGVRILEIGCSAGQWPYRLGLQDKNCTYTGIDINQKSIDFANEYFKDHKNINFLCGDLRDVDFYGAYDLVISCQTLFFLEPELVNIVMSRLANNAILVLQEPVNTDFEQRPESVCMEGSNPQNIGFSHNYIAMLEHNGYETLYKEIITVKDTKLLMAARKK